MCGGKCKTKQKNRKVFHKKLGVSACNEMERFGFGLLPDNTCTRARGNLTRFYGLLTICDAGLLTSI